MGQPNGVTTSFVVSTKMYLSYIYGAWTTFSQIDLTIFYIKRQGLQVLAKTLPISLRFNNVSPVIRLLQVGAFSASQSPVAFWLLGRKR